MAGLKDKAWHFAEVFGLTPERMGGTRRRDIFDQLERMRADNNQARAHFQGGPIWQLLGRRFTRWFAFDGIENIEDHPMNGLFSSPQAGNPKLLRYACWMLYRDIVRRDHLKLLDRIPATGGQAFVFDGRRVTWDLLISLDTLYAIAEIDPRILTHTVNVGELGAGWGRFGYVLKLANPRARYIVFDLPEVLIVSQTHLPRRLSGVVSTYDMNRDDPLTRERLAAADMTFLGAQDLDRVEDAALDFMVNVASFQEMSRETVAAYFADISRVLAGTLYTQQLWSSSTHAYEVGEISGWDAYPWPSAWVATLKRNATWSDLYFEAAFHVGARHDLNSFHSSPARALKER